MKKVNKPCKKILLGLLVVFSLQTATSQPVTVSRDVKHTAAHRYEVEMLIHKRDMGGFAQLIQELPENISLKTTEYGGSELQRKQGRAVYTWLHLPLQDTLKLAFTLNTENMGDNTLSGEFSYQVQNNMASILLKPLKVKGGSISSAGTGNTSIHKNAGQKDAGANGDKHKNDGNAGTLKGSRKITTQGEEYLITVTLQAPNTKGAIKLKEKVPANYTGRPDELSGASFSLNKGNMIFTWPEARNKLRVSYLLQAQEGAETPPGISGQVSTSANGYAKKQDIPTTSVKIDEKDEGRLKDAKDLWGN